MQHCINSYKSVVTHDYHRIQTSISGTEKNVMLILGRKTSPSSIIEMKPLVSFLEDEYTVVTPDYLGTGSSDNYHSMRTLEKITSEIHEVMAQLGYSSYVIAALAYAGLYALYYANKYPDEVKAIIGIDCFVSEQRKNEIHEESVKFTNDIWLNFHSSRLARWIVIMSAKHYLKTATAYDYSQAETELFSDSAAYMLENMTLLDEYKCPEENFKTLDNMSFPTHIPVLFILSSFRNRKIKCWYSLHEKQLQNSSSKIITLKGGKALHLKKPKRLAEEIKAFLHG